MLIHSFPVEFTLSIGLLSILSLLVHIQRFSSNSFFSEFILTVGGSRGKELSTDTR